MMDVIITVIKIVLALVWFLTLTLYLTWLERKESAVIQDRIGANRANVGKFRFIGLFQPFADAIKMIFKEDFVPAFSNKLLHTLAPFLSFFFVGYQDLWGDRPLKGLLLLFVFFIFLLRFQT